MVGFEAALQGTLSDALCNSKVQMCHSLMLCPLCVKRSSFLPCPYCANTQVGKWDPIARKPLSEESLVLNLALRTAIQVGAGWGIILCVGVASALISFNTPRVRAYA